VKFYHTIQGTDEILLVSNATKAREQNCLFQKLYIVVLDASSNALRGETQHLLPSTIWLPMVTTFRISV